MRCSAGVGGHSWLGSRCLPEPPGSEGDDCGKKRYLGELLLPWGLGSPMCADKELAQGY